MDDPTIPEAAITIVFGARPALRRWLSTSLSGRRAVPVAAIRAVDREAGELPSDAAVLECGPLVRPLDLLATIGDDGHRVVDVVVTVVDARTVLAQLADDRYVRRVDDTVEVLVSRAGILAEQIEHADAIVVVGHGVEDPDGFARVLAVLSHLNPTAQLALPRGRRVDIRGRAVGAPPREQAPGWLRMLNDDFDPTFRHEAVDTFRYRAELPFHPRRVNQLLVEGWTSGRYGSIIRSVGFCRFATRPGRTGIWDQTGPTISLEPGVADATDTADAAADSAGSADTSDAALGSAQDLAITGIDLEVAALTAALDACTLRPDEFVAGPELWSTLVDPLPAWRGL